MNQKPKIGIVIGNRPFFPAHLIESGRQTILEVLTQEGIEPITLRKDETVYGGVSNYAEAQKSANMLKAHRDELDGILVTLPNFGDEKAVADTIRLANLNLPILIHAFNDEIGLMSAENRRDSFCGKMSVCNNLNQYGIPFTLPQLHTSDPLSDSFRTDLRQFAAVCRIVRGFKNVRIGALGARPTAFNTVRYSEKLLELSGISVDTLDLSEAFGRASRIKDDNRSLKMKLDEIRNYLVIKTVPDSSLTKMAKLAVVIDKWMKDNELSATAIQCWTSIEQYYGITPCTIMSMLSNNLLPSACETDVTGVLSMYAMVLASGKPSALLDWNNNYGDNPDKAVVFHCSNLPKELFEDTPLMTFSDIFANDVGQENAYGTVSGRIKAQPFTYCRISTDDTNGQILAYVGEGEFTNDKVVTFGGYGVAYVKNLQDLLRYICYYGFEHHVAVNPSQTANAVQEAFEKYLGWNVYRHNSN